MQNAVPRVLPAAAFVGVFLAWALPCDVASAAKPRDFGTTTTVSGKLHLASPAAAQTTISNSPICTAVNDQLAPVMVADGSGNTIAVWADYRGNNFDIYAQKLNGSGSSVWFLDGVGVCKDPADQISPRAASDGAGGVIVVWQDARAGARDIYAQRIDPFGTPLWTGNGIVICNAANDQLAPVIVSDGVGGAVIAWTDDRTAAGNSDVYAQRVNASGIVQWAANGVLLCSAAGVQRNLTIAGDGSQGAYVAWQDYRGSQFVSDIYAMRVTAAGVPQGIANGTPLCVATNSQESPLAVSDGGGGVIVGWEDHRGFYWDVYAQRFNTTVQWAVDGVPVCAANLDQPAFSMASDGSAGALFAWQDGRSGTDFDIYAQRISPTGSPLWTLDGVAVCTATADQTAPDVRRDPAGCALVAWSDARSATTGADVYTQRLNSTGLPQWTAGGVQLCDAPNVQDGATLAADGVGGALVAWHDLRGLAADLYAQTIDVSGVVGNQCVPPDTLRESVPLTLTAPQNYECFYNNVGGFPAYYWVGVGVRSAPGSDWDIEGYDQQTWGQAAYPSCFGGSLAGSFASGVVDFVVYNENENHTPPGVYGTRASRYSGTGNGTIEFDGKDDLITLSSAASPNHAVSSPVGWTGVLDIYDVGLTAGITYTFDLVKSPSDADLRVLLFSSVGWPDYYYVVPRSSRVFEQTERYFQWQAPATDYYGVVITNETGAPAQYTLKVWSDAPTTGVGGKGPNGLTTGIHSVSPNPAHGRATINFSLSEGSDVSFDVLDMAGRVVSRIPSHHWQPGVWSVDWDGRSSGASSLSTGIYFVQMQVNGRRVGLGRVALIQ